MATIFRLLFLSAGGYACLAGMAFIFVGFLIGQDAYSTFANGTKTIATIVDIKEKVETRTKKKNGKETTYQVTLKRPVVEFVYQGQKKQFVSTSASSSFDIPIGETVDVFYDPEKPKYFKIDQGFFQNYLGAIGFAGIGLAAFLFGAYRIYIVW